jgi:hypothetical protein
MFFGKNAQIRCHKDLDDFSGELGSEEQEHTVDAMPAAGASEFIHKNNRTTETIKTIPKHES